MLKIKKECIIPIIAGFFSYDHFYMAKFDEITVGKGFVTMVRLTVSDHGEVFFCLIGNSNLEVSSFFKERHPRIHGLIFKNKCLITDDGHGRPCILLT